MQTTKLSSNDLVEAFTEDAKLVDVIQRLEDDLAERGEVVCEIRVNDIFLSEKDEKRLAGATISEIDTLEVQSRRPDELVRESIGSMKEFIPDLKDHCLKLADVARSGELTGQHKKFVEVFDGCHWVTEALSLLKGPLLADKEPEIYEQWKKTEGAYARSIRELLTSFEKQDYVLVSDVLEYDITQALDEWLVLLKTQVS